jgi:hypothetical protein
MPSKDLRESCTMEGLQHRPVVIKLSERGVEGDEKRIVDTWVAYVMSNGGDQKRQSIERLQE